MSEFHFLRVFKQVTKVTPHQYILRARLREAALRLKTGAVLDMALDIGFGDISNFNHAFRAEFGASPQAYRLQARGPTREIPHQATLENDQVGLDFPGAVP